MSGARLAMRGPLSGTGLMIFLVSIHYPSGDPRRTGWRMPEGPVHPGSRWARRPVLDRDAHPSFAERFLPMIRAKRALRISARFHLIRSRSVVL